MEVKCHGCNGQGWVQVIDPPTYTYKVSGGQGTGAVEPPVYTFGTARAVQCPVCKGSGKYFLTEQG